MSHHEPESKRRRGRPRANGQQPGWMLFRAFEILRVYQSLRDAGNKYAYAVRETRDVLRKQYPDMRISETEIKRVLRSMYDPHSRVEWAVRPNATAGGSLSYGVYERACPRSPYRKPSQRAPKNNERTD